MQTTTTTTIRRARSRGCPLVAIRTQDYRETMREVAAITSREIGGDADAAHVYWDCVDGMVGINDLGRAWIEQQPQGTTQPLPIALRRAKELPASAVLHVANAHLAIDNPQVIQGLMNLRDAFKADNRTAYLYGSDIRVPADLRNDVLTVEDALPTEDEIMERVKAVGESIKANAPDFRLDDESAARTAESLRGEKPRRGRHRAREGRRSPARDCAKG